MRLFDVLFKSHIKKLDVSVTNMCNQRCKTCNIWRIYKDNPQLKDSEVTLREYENFFKKYNFWTNLSFTGGEPFLRKDFSDIVKCAVQSCPNLKMISLNTNGFATDLIIDKTKKIKEFSKRKGLHINISLDGLPHVHDNSRGIEGAYENAVRTFDELQNIKNSLMKVTFEYTVSRYNQGRLREFMEKNSISANDIVLTFGQDSYRYGESKPSVRPDIQLTKKDIKYFASRLKPKTILNIGQWIFLIHYLYGLRIPCVAGRDTFHADALGNIYLCTLLNTKVGSIKENVLKEASPPKDCYCYTPCESYYGLMKHKGKSLCKAIYKNFMKKGGGYEQL